MDNVRVIQARVMQWLLLHNTLLARGDKFHYKLSVAALQIPDLLLILRGLKRLKHLLSGLLVSLIQLWIVPLNLGHVEELRPIYVLVERRSAW